MNINEFIEIQIQYLNEFGKAVKTNTVATVFSRSEFTYIKWNKIFEHWVDKYKTEENGLKED